MKEDKNIRTSTIRVSKNTLDEIKIYCRKNGKTIGEWADSVWRFIKKNDFDIFDEEVTPSLPVAGSSTIDNAQIVSLGNSMLEFVQAQKEESLKIAALCQMTEKIISSRNTPQLPAYNLDKVTELATERANAQAKLREQEKDIKRLEDEIKRLESSVASLTIYKENAHRELCKVRDEQKFIGKIEVRTEF